MESAEYQPGSVLFVPDAEGGAYAAWQVKSCVGFGKDATVQAAPHGGGATRTLSADEGLRLPGTRR